jgi:hypothetical protein
MPPEENPEIPDTVAEMLQQLGGLDLGGLKELGKGMGAVFNGALEETGNAMAALGLASAWITAIVQNPNGDNGEDGEDTDRA